MCWSRIMAPCPCIHFEIKGITDSRQLFCCVVSCEGYYWTILAAISFFLGLVTISFSSVQEDVLKLAMVSEEWDGTPISPSLQDRLHCYRKAVWHPQQSWSLRSPWPTLQPDPPNLEEGKRAGCVPTCRAGCVLGVTPSMMQVLSQNWAKARGKWLEHGRVLWHQGTYKTSGTPWCRDNKWPEMMPSMSQKNHSGNYFMNNTSTTKTLPLCWRQKK